MSLMSSLVPHYSTTPTGAYNQYAVTPGNSTGYNAPRPGYDQQAYHPAAASQGSYGSKLPYSHSSEQIPQIGLAHEIRVPSPYTLSLIPLYRPSGTGQPTPTYDYGYGRPTQTYDTSKTYYQQTAGYTAGSAAPSSYDNSGGSSKVPGYQPPTTYAQPRSAMPSAKASQYNSGYASQQSSYATPAGNSSAVPKGELSSFDYCDWWYDTPKPTLINSNFTNILNI